MLRLQHSPLLFTFCSSILSKYRNHQKFETFVIALQLFYVSLLILRFSYYFSAPMMWRFLIADDLDVEYFLVRDTDSRLSMRDGLAVTEWIRLHNDSAFHCMRDHPSHG